MKNSNRMHIKKKKKTDSIRSVACNCAPYMEQITMDRYCDQMERNSLVSKNIDGASSLIGIRNLIIQNGTANHIASKYFPKMDTTKHTETFGHFPL